MGSIPGPAQWVNDPLLPQLWHHSCSWDSNPGLGASICCRCSPKQTKKKKKRKKRKQKKEKKKKLGWVSIERSIANTSSSVATGISTQPEGLFQGWAMIWASLFRVNLRTFETGPEKKLSRKLNLNLGRHEPGDTIPKVAGIYCTTVLKSRVPSQLREGRVKRWRETTLWHHLSPESFSVPLASRF